ncbi:restriction endonuclease [Streptomyces sp. NL15-2K]|uniref:restriction endonuclease n=2 Tax=Streptomyces sp. NL15-2K TaxID=376149 RepID=UPI000F57D6FA|nr:MULTISPECIES: restriction endonuclease [Actinomycetes]WKX09898.1 restriction endonuclease [Kutzneria buriramensis]
MRITPFDEFRSLENGKTPQRRGIEFERFLLRLLRIAGLRAERDSSISPPRQTDLVASYGGQTYLIEAKWESKPVSIDVVDAVEARLRRTSPSVVGVIVSMSGFSSTCLEEVVRKRGDRAIILMDRNDIEAAIEDPVKLRWILHTKHQRLVRMAEVWFHDSVLTRAYSRWQEPEDDHSQLMSVNGGPIPWVANSTDFKSPVFGHLHIPLDELERRGVAVVDLFPAIRSLASLRQLLIDLHENGKCDGAFRWTLSKRPKALHGIGRPSLTDLLSSENGYEGQRATLHCYGSSGDEFWSLSVDIHDEGEVDNCDLSFVMQQLPLDTTRFQHITDTFGSWMESRVSWDHGVNFAHGRIDPAIELEIAGYITSREVTSSGEEQLRVTGVLAHNPLKNGTPFPKSIGIGPSWNEISYVLCDVAPHCAWKERKGRYMLTGWVSAFAAGSVVVALEGARNPPRQYWNQ